MDTRRLAPGDLEVDEDCASASNILTSSQPFIPTNISLSHHGSMAIRNIPRRRESPSQGHGCDQPSIQPEDTLRRLSIIRCGMQDMLYCTTFWSGEQVKSRGGNREKRRRGSQALIRPS